MRKHSNSFYHRLFLLGVLFTGATLLLVNVWMITSNESDLLMMTWLE